MNDEIIRNKKLFLLDMDGTIYLEDELIDGASEFIDKLIAKNINYVFLTNNSSKSAREYLVKLEKLGIPATIDNIFTAGMATALYLRNIKEGARIFVMGTQALKNEFREYAFDVVETGDDDIDYVVAGYDTELTYEKLKIATLYLASGVPFIATNPDLVYPMSKTRFLPDCGSMCQMLEIATGKKPKYIGKPRREMVDVIAKRMNIELSDIAMVGDRLYTDIALGINAGITSICLLSGETRREELPTSEIKPDFVFESIAELIPIMN
ncbi:MAG: HAD-IIA family hydrolase [Planctomycetes bacterium]|nr:HAD-IIA family hydrolase [Planctomycetota bacterium]